MRKWLAVSIQIPFIAMMWVACSGDDSGVGDAGDASSKDVTLDKKTLPDVAVPDTGPSCTPATVAPGDLTWTPPHAPDLTACSDQQIQDYFTNCLPGSGTSCATYEKLTANAACIKCIISQKTDATYGPLIAVPNGVVYANTGGCVALEQGDVTNTGCGAKIWEESECEDLACSDNCAGAAFADYQKCTTAARSGTCAAEVTAECNLADAGNVAACNLAATSFQALYTSIATVFCGGYPAGDGGTPDGGMTDAAADAPDGD